MTETMRDELYDRQERMRQDFAALSDEVRARKRELRGTGDREATAALHEVEEVLRIAEDGFDLAVRMLARQESR